MARAETTDYMQNFRFHVYAETDVPLEFTGQDGLFGGEAGFQSVSIPEISTDASEYREGTMTWTRKQPGIPTVTTATLTRGVCRRDTTFYDWMMRSVDGGGTYRTDLVILQFHRDEPRVDGGALSRSAKRKVILREAFPTRAKPTSDLDASSGDISVGEIDLEFEQLELLVD